MCSQLHACVGVGCAERKDQLGGDIEYSVLWDFSGSQGWGEAKTVPWLSKGLGLSLGEQPGLRGHWERRESHIKGMALTELGRHEVCFKVCSRSWTADGWKVLSKGELVLLNGGAPRGPRGSSRRACPLPTLSHTHRETGAFIS